MPRFSPKTVYSKLSRLEKELQRLKVEAYFTLPQRPVRPASMYTEPAILQALQDTRNAIWQERYAKKTTGIR